MGDVCFGPHPLLVLVGSETWKKGGLKMSNWYDDQVCWPVKERLNKISTLCQDRTDVLDLVEQCFIIIDSAGTECPAMVEVE